MKKHIFYSMATVVITIVAGGKANAQSQMTLKTAPQKAKRKIVVGDATLNTNNGENNIIY